MQKRIEGLARALALVGLATVGALSFGQTAVWTGPGSVFATPANWQGGVAPPNDGSTTIDFSFTAAQTSVTFNAPANVLGLYFYTSNSIENYGLNGTGPLTVGAGGLTFQAGIDAVVSVGLPLFLSANETVQGGSSGYTALYGNVSETGGSRALTTAGRVYLFGNNTFSGGLDVTSGTAYLVSDTAAGSGPINVASGASLQSYYTTVTEANALTIQDGAYFGNSGFQGPGPQLNFTGTVTLGSSSTTLNIYSYSSVGMQGLLTGPPSSQLALSGSAAKLPVDGGSELVLQGATSNIGAINVLESLLILAPTGPSSSAYPGLGATGLTVGNADLPGYLGLDGTFSQPGAVSAFLTTYGAGLGSAINGTLGFDTFSSPSTPSTFNDPINLSGFSSPTFLGLGSSSAAILGAAAVLTPYNATTGYLFGGGGGTLTVLSTLADDGGATPLTMTSAPAPLTLILRGSNTYTGGTFVNGGVLVFDSPLPPTGTIFVAPQGYVGYTENAGGILAAAFISQINATGAGGVIGFDSASVGSPRTISDPIDLSSFNSENNPFIGSATSVTLSGTITPANSTYQFTGVKGGSLTIASPLTGAGNSVTVGLSSPIESNASTSIVNLTSSGNTYGNGTTINSGTLFILATSSLGTGPVSVPDTASTNVAPYLSPFGGTLTLANAISIGSISGNPGLSVGDAYTTNQLVLSGVISDAPSQNGYLAVTGPVTLSGINTYSGGTEITGNSTIDNAQIFVTNSSSLGTGTLTVQANGVLAPSGASVALPNAILLNNTVLTLGQGGNPNLLTLAGMISGGGSLVIDSGVVLTAANSFSGGTTVNNAIVAVTNASALGTGSVQLNASTIAYGLTNPAALDLMGDSSSSIGLTTGSTFTLNTDTASTSFTFNGTIVGDGTVQVVKTGTGTEILTGTSTYGGGTVVSTGTLVAGSSGAFGTGGLTVYPGAVVGVDTGATLTNPLAYGSGATFSGRGTYSTPGGITFSGGTTVAPGIALAGERIATLSFTNSVTFGSGGTYSFNVSNAAGSPGIDYDSVNLSGALTITALPSNPFVINLASVDPGTGDPGLATFVSSTPYTWTLVSAASITGFAANEFTVNTASFQDPLAGGVFSITQSGSSLELNFTPVPEPSTWTMMALGIGVSIIANSIRRDRRVGKS